MKFSKLPLLFAVVLSAFALSQASRAASVSEPLHSLQQSPQHSMKLVFPDLSSGQGMENGTASHSHLIKATLEIDKVDPQDPQVVYETLIPVRVRITNHTGLDAMANQIPNMEFSKVDAKPLKDIFGKYEGAEIGIGAVFGGSMVQMTNSSGIVMKGSHKGFAEGFRMSGKTMWLERDTTENTAQVITRIGDKQSAFESINVVDLLKKIIVIGIAIKTIEDLEGNVDSTSQYF